MASEWDDERLIKMSENETEWDEMRTGKQNAKTSTRLQGAPVLPQRHLNPKHVYAFDPTLSNLIRPAVDVCVCVMYIKIGYRQACQHMKYISEHPQRATPNENIKTNTHEQIENIVNK